MAAVFADQDAMAPRHEMRLEVMGTIAHVITIGDRGDELIEGATAHLRELEARWSRFESSSEISRLNASAGAPLVVSAPTVALIELGVEGWRVSNGCFDPTVLGDVMRAGYDRSFCEITDATARVATSVFRRGCDGIEVDPASGSVRLPTGVGIDPGGIGKGLAADLVIDALRATGAEGACVNVGGDVRVAGAAPGDGWVIELSRSGSSRVRVAVRIADGAVATQRAQLSVVVPFRIAQASSDRSEDRGTGRQRHRERFRRRRAGLAGRGAHQGDLRGRRHGRARTRGRTGRSRARRDGRRHAPCEPVVVQPGHARRFPQQSGGG